jgi:hypothetical protein
MIADRLPRLPVPGRDPAEDVAVAAYDDAGDGGRDGAGRDGAAADGSGEPVSARDYVGVRTEEVGAHAAARG